MKTKKIVIIFIAIISMSFIGNETDKNEISISTATTELSINDSSVGCNSGFYNIRIYWVDNSITNAEKTAVRASFDIYGRSPIFQIFPDGSERWVFNLDNMSPSVTVLGMCRSTTVENEVDDHEEVEAREVRENNR